MKATFRSCPWSLPKIAAPQRKLSVAFGHWVSVVAEVGSAYPFLFLSSSFFVIIVVVVVVVVLVVVSWFFVWVCFCVCFCLFWFAFLSFFFFFYFNCQALQRVPLHAEHLRAELQSSLFGSIISHQSARWVVVAAFSVHCTRPPSVLPCLLLLLVRQMKTPVSSMKVAVHRTSPRLA